MNAEALAATQERGEAHFWSRSRDELWHKGATSGHVQTVRALRYDCDADAILALVEPHGPACHTGERTCFHQGQLAPAAPHEALPALERTVAARAAREESDERVAEEAADVLYHLTVLLHSRGLSLADAEQVLDGRRR